MINLFSILFIVIKILNSVYCWGINLCIWVMFNVERINNERDILGIYCVVDFIVFIEKNLLINYFIIVRYILNFKLD